MRAKLTFVDRGPGSLLEGGGDSPTAELACGNPRTGSRDGPLEQQVMAVPVGTVLLIGFPHQSDEGPMKEVLEGP